MKQKCVKTDDIDRVIIAGAFGSHINPKNLKFLGMIPDVTTEKIEFVGNTAVIGAKIALTSKEARETAQILSNKIRYLELAMDGDFKQEFTKALLIPHADSDRFPLVEEDLKRSSVR